MYYFNSHNNFSGEHLYNAKRIKIRRYKCEVNKLTGELIFKLIGISRILSFNKQGVLQEVVEFTDSRITKLVYTYNKKGKIISIISFNLVNNQLNNIILLTYDNKDRIINEEVITTSFYQNDLIVQEEYDHEYEDNIHVVTFEQEIISTFSHLSDYDEWTFEEKLNDCDQVVEFKSSALHAGFHMWTKYHYSNYGELTHEIDLDEDGVVFSETLYDKDNWVYKYENKSIPESSVYESKFEYNEKGHWIKEYTLHNGELRFVTEKTIDYYI